MELLASPKDINRWFVRLLNRGASLDADVAWASYDIPAVRVLVQRQEQVARMSVGLHFYQTHPDFIRTFQKNSRVRFVHATDGVFHPKVFLFSLPNGAWECAVGSANFTRGGFSSNVEAAVQVGSDDVGADRFRAEMDVFLEDAWNQAIPMSNDVFNGYEAMWQRRAPLLGRLKGRFGVSSRDEQSGDKGLSPVEAPLLTETWSSYFARVRGDLNLDMRRKILKYAREQFVEYGSLKDMPRQSRRRLAGFAPHDGEVDWMIFGSMRGAGKFKGLINRDPDGLSEALDAIPLDGAIAREHYDRFATSFQRSFQAGRGGGNNAIATATRLLAMKRPDYFVCLDSKNRAELCGDLRIRKSVGLREYYPSLCERIQESAWWGTSEPSEGLEQEIWRGRAAFLDSIYYRPDG